MHHHHQPQQYNSAFALAALLNTAFVIVEASYAFSANSSSLLADAGHNLGDIFGLLFAWLANVLLSKPPGERFSYGFKKTTILAAFVNALLLVLAAAGIAYAALDSLLNPVVVHEPTVIAVALVGIAVNGGTALLFMQGRHHDLNIKATFLHLASDALISFGVVLTGVVMLLSAWYWLDPVVGLLIVVTIFYSTWGLLRDSVNLLLAAVPSQIEHQQVRQYLLTIPGVTAVHDLHIWALSTLEVALTAHLVMPDAGLDDHDYQRINCELVKQFGIHHVTLQIETGNHEHGCGQLHNCR